MIREITQIKVYEGDNLVYSSDTDLDVRSMRSSVDFSCHSFGLPVEPIGCYNEGVHVAFPDGNHLEVMPKHSLYQIYYIWTPSGPWSPVSWPCPT